MNQFFALLSVVFMIGFVLVFDRLHRAGYITWFCNHQLLTTTELEQLRRIVSSCE